MPLVGESLENGCAKAEEETLGTSFDSFYPSCLSGIASEIAYAGVTGSQLSSFLEIISLIPQSVDASGF